MASYGKRLRAVQELLDQGKRYGVEEAFELFPQTTTAKFDESVDIAVRLGVDPRKADQMVRGAISLPHGIGKSVVVVVFAQGDAARAAEEAASANQQSGYTRCRYETYKNLTGRWVTRKVCN